MRLRQPLRQLGEVKSRARGYQQQSRVVVMVRSKGRCEACGKLTRRLEWAHLFGRRHLVAEPYCSSPELTMALCCYDPLSNTIGCHERIDRGLDLKLRHQLQVIATTRFYEAHKARKLALISTEPVGAVRRLVKRLEKEAT